MVVSEAEAARVALFGTRGEKLKVAAGALYRLMRHPEDLKQVFLLGLAANARRFPRLLLRFVASEDGGDLLRAQPSIDTSTVDFEAMRRMPDGTLGREYVRYLEENKLDPDLFQAPPGLPPMIAWMAKRIRQTHDIWHVLTGYKPDMSGEVALQAFTFAQTEMPSAALIAVFGSIRALPRDRKILRKSVDGYRRGKKAAFLPVVKWEEHFARDIGDVRTDLGIVPAAA
jgi:ubiquinone biosynthesis protein COQ4